MAKEEYGVDLDALDQVVKELNHILSRMGGPSSPCTKVASGTYLKPGALGKDFSEADDLYNAHTKMKDYIEKNILDAIQAFIDDFGKKSAQTKGAYEDAEHENTLKSL